MDNKKIDTLIGRKFFNKYTLIKKLGEGSFGAVYEAKDENDDLYAIKLEDKNKEQNLLENEAYIMGYLGTDRIPYVKSYGYSGHYNILIMEFMGKSLEDLLETLKEKRMSVRTVANIGIQMIEILRPIHNKFIIHRDIKPDNFVVGRGEKKKYIFLLDFGLAKKFRSSTTLDHYPRIKKKKLTGTARYASINALDGWTQSRADDLESVGYVLMYFLRGRLPWQGLKARNNEDRYQLIKEKKQETSPEELCRGFPDEFKEYISYTRNLSYEEDPDYDMLITLFRSVLSRDGFKFDYFYDWDNDCKSMYSSTSGFTNKAQLMKVKGKNNEEENEQNDKVQMQASNRPLINSIAINNETLQNIMQLTGQNPQSIVVSPEKPINATIANKILQTNNHLPDIKEEEKENNLVGNNNLLISNAEAINTAFKDSKINQNSRKNLDEINTNEIEMDNENQREKNSRKENKVAKRQKREEDSKCCIII